MFALDFVASPTRSPCRMFFLQVLLSGFLDNVARRAPAGTVKAGSKLQRDCAYLSCNEAVTEAIYIKSSSVLFSRDPQDLPEWVVYQARREDVFFVAFGFWWFC